MTKSGIWFIRVHCIGIYRINLSWIFGITIATVELIFLIIFVNNITILIFFFYVLYRENMQVNWYILIFSIYFLKLLTCIFGKVSKKASTRHWFGIDIQKVFVNCCGGEGGGENIFTSSNLGFLNLLTASIFHKTYNDCIIKINYVCNETTKSSRENSIRFCFHKTILEGVRSFMEEIFLIFNNKRCTFLTK